MKKFFKWLLIFIISLIVIFISGNMIVPKVAPQFGATPKGERLERIKKSPQYRNNKFYNLVETPMSGENTSMWESAWKFIKGGENREPKKVIETIPFSKTEFESGTSGISFSWFGHSTVLLRVDGKNILIDPVFSNYASPFSFLGTKGFQYSNRTLLNDLPNIDAVLISHDHYDHLDYETIKLLNEKVDRFYVPLGVAAHLEKWGIPVENIIEMDWWDESIFDKNLTFAAVPMRHFSGRGVMDRYSTLWVGWVIQSRNYSIIHTGDSGYGDHFKTIGDKYGPFDLTMVECGQYNEGWPYIHMMPEQSVQAHIDLKGKYMMPIHWGRFNLSLHEWTDPVERATAEATKKNVEILTPVVGDIFNLKPTLPKERWWER